MSDEIEMTFWHGGPRIVGDMVLSPIAQQRLSRSGEGDGTFVYLATERGLAMNYAATCNGWLYEVKPVGEVLQDPHSILAPGVSVMCGSAKILRRFKPSRAEVEMRSRHVSLIDSMLPREPRE